MKIELIKPVSGYPAPPITISVSDARGRALIDMGKARMIETSIGWMVRDDPPKRRTKKKAVNQKAVNRETRAET